MVHHDRSGTRMEAEAGARGRTGSPRLPLGTLICERSRVPFPGEKSRIWTKPFDKLESMTWSSYLKSLSLGRAFQPFPELSRPMIDGVRTWIRSLRSAAVHSAPRTAPGDPPPDRGLPPHRPAPRRRRQGDHAGGGRRSLRASVTGQYPGTQGRGRSRRSDRNLRHHPQGRPRISKTTAYEWRDRFTGEEDPPGKTLGESSTEPPDGA